MIRNFRKKREENEAAVAQETITNGLNVDKQANHDIVSRVIALVHNNEEAVSLLKKLEF